MNTDAPRTPMRHERRCAMNTDAMSHRRAVACVRSATVLALSLAAGAGCHIPPQHDVEEYRKVLDASVPPIEEPEREQSLSVQQAMAIANQHNEQLGLGGENYVQALIDKNRAAAAFLPTISLQPSYTIADRPNNFSPTPSIANAGAFVARGDTIQRLEVPVVGSMNVFRGMGDVADLRAAEAVIAQRRELLLDLQATVMLNVAQTYYSVLRSERSSDVLRNSLKVQEARLADVEQQLRNGLATRLTVAQTRAQVDATRVLLLQSVSDGANGRHVLAQLVGLPAVENPLSETVVTPENLDEEAEFERIALDERADLRAARSGVDAAKHLVDAAIAEYYPSVSLNVSGFLYRELYADGSKWAAILSANLPLFSAGVIEADVRTAWSMLRQAALDESAVRRAALRDVQVAYENLVTSRRRIVELEDEVAAADEAYQQAQSAYKNGLAINLDVLNAQDQLLNAQLQLTGARFDRDVFYLDLVRATGRLAHGVVPDAEQPGAQAEAQPGAGDAAPR
jgi:outer membrane protein TolC